MSLTLDKLDFRAGGNAILKNINAQVSKGKITAIVGANGSGKSSLLNLMAGAERPTGGQIQLNGKRLNSWSKKTLAMVLAVLPQSLSRPLGMTVYDLVSCGRFPYTGTWKRFSASDHQAVIEALEKTDLLERKEERIDHLSGGEMQRVWLAMVLAQQTDILLLDEPTSYLDVSHQLQLLEIVRDLNRSLGITVVWVLHDLNHALQYSDEIWVMHEGSLVRQGDANSIVNAPLLNQYFGIDAEFVHSDHLTVPTIVALRQGSLFKVVNGKAG